MEKKNSGKDKKTMASYGVLLLDNKTDMSDTSVRSLKKRGSKTIA